MPSVQLGIAELEVRVAERNSLVEVLETVKPPQVESLDVLIDRLPFYDRHNVDCLVSKVNDELGLVEIGGEVVGVSSKEAINTQHHPWNLVTLKQLFEENVAR